jgi:hypothetical protein
MNTPLPQVLDEDPEGWIGVDPPKPTLPPDVPPLDCSPACPWRPVDWRWQMAVWVAEGRRRPEHPWVDDRIRRASRFVAVLARRAYPNNQHLVRRFGAIAEAHRLHVAASQPVRAELEARLIAGQDDDAIAGKMGLSPAAVGTHHDLFYSVRELLAAEGVVLGVIYQGPYHRQLTDGDRDVILRLIGFYAGPLMIDEVLAYWADPVRLSVDFTRLSQPELAVAYRRVSIRAVLATLTLPATKRAMSELNALQELRQQMRLALSRPPETSFALRLTDNWIDRCLRDVRARPEAQEPAHLARPAAGPADSPQPAACASNGPPPPNAAPAQPAAVHAA